MLDCLAHLMLLRNFIFLCCWDTYSMGWKASEKFLRSLRWQRFDIVQKIFSFFLFSVDGIETEARKHARAISAFMTTLKQNQQQLKHQVSC